MITKEITLCGKQVMLAYCYATEISYKILSDEDIINFSQEIVEKIQHEQMPDIRKTLNLIIASIMSYYESLPFSQDGEKQKAPITDKDLMNEAAPQEIGIALGTILGLRSQFYHVPSDEPKDKPADGKEEKNA